MGKKKSDTNRKSGGHILSDIMLLVCAAIFCFAVWKLWGMYQGYHGGEKEYEKLRQHVTVREKKDEDGGTGQAGPDVCPLQVDFDALKEINPQLVAWLYIPDSEISYPIVQGEDNYHYLNYTFEGKKNFTGAIFLDALCQPDFKSDNSIVYGHNLKSGEMFGFLKTYYDTNYNEKADFRRRQIVWVIRPGEELEYRIFSAREISARKDKDVYTVEFGSDQSFGDYLDQAVEDSLYDTGVKTVADRILTLSTCTSSSEDGRFILQATLIQD